MFLKHEAWALQAGTTMISDVDFLVLNPHRMANFLMECDANTDFGRMLTRGRAAVMSRTTSRVNEDARPRLEPRTDTGEAPQWNTWTSCHIALR